VPVTEEQWTEWSGGERLPEVDYRVHPLVVNRKLVEALFTRRARVNSQAEDAGDEVRVERNQIPEGFDAAAVRGLDSKTVLERQVAGRTHNQAHTGRQARSVSLREDVERLRESLAAAEQALRDNDDWLQANPLIDLAEIDREVGGFTQNMEALRHYDRAAEAERRQATLQGQADALTELIDAGRDRPTEMLKAAKEAGRMPIPGLGLDEGERVTYEGLPLDAMGSGNRIRLAVQVAKAQAAALPLMLVDGFEALDSAHQQLFLEEAKVSGMEWVIAETTDGEFEVIYLDAEDGPDDAKLPYPPSPEEMFAPTVMLGGETLEDVESFELRFEGAPGELLDAPDCHGGVGPQGHVTDAEEDGEE
jgi:hypothetical protein